MYGKPQFKPTAEQAAWLAAKSSEPQVYAELTREFNARFHTACSRWQIAAAAKKQGVKSVWHERDLLVAEANRQKRKGHICWKRRPIGSTRQTRDGVEIKYSDTGKSRRDMWMPRSKYVWQQHHGEIPQGRMVFHIDGDKNNDDIENLFLIKRNDIGKLNASGYNQAPLEIRKSLLLQMRLDTEIKEKTGRQTPSMRYADKKKAQKQAAEQQQKAQEQAAT